MRVPFSLGALLASSLAATVALVACGARSELDALLGPERPDAGIDAAEDVAADVPEDVPEDVPPDVMPECFGPEVTWIYVVTDFDSLWAFKPQTNTFSFIGFLDCPFVGASTPFSMAVARDGVAHVVYQNGQLFRLSVFDANCEETPFVPIAEGDPFHVFGMGHEANPDGDETLYVADITFTNPSLGLASLDTDTYQLSYIGPFSDNPGNALELTPTGSSGPLYGYFLNAPPPGGTLVQIDTTSAGIVESTPLTVGNGDSSLAVAWWGGDFYIFLGQGGTTQVTRYDPDSQATNVVATLGEHVVGAGVSTCAPDFPE